MGKHCRNLEGSHHSQPRNIRRLQCSNVTALERDAAARGIQKFCQKIEAGGLARAIRPDQRVYRPARDTQVDIVDRYKARKLLGELLGFEDDVLTHRYRFPHSLRIFRTFRAYRPEQNRLVLPRAKSSQRLPGEKPDFATRSR
jgi:hypothetical protein